MRKRVRLQSNKIKQPALRIDRLKALRKKMNLTQKEVGEKIGLSDKTISSYEQGDRQPDNETLLKLANFFGVSVSYLLGETDNPTLLDDRIVILTDKDIEDMPLEARETVLSIIDAIIDAVKKKHGN
jgi:transcriptional regulator with XRE-family HTH domain